MLSRAFSESADCRFSRVVRALPGLEFPREPSIKSPRFASLFCVELVIRSDRAAFAAVPVVASWWDLVVGIVGVLVLRDH